MSLPVRLVAVNRAPTPSVVLLAVLFSLLLSSCPSPDDDDPCSCPNLAAVVASIDWAGDGATRIDVDDTLEGPEGFPRRASGRLAVADTGVTLDLIAVRMSTSGAVLVSSDAFNRAYGGDGWQAVIGVSDLAELIIHVDIATKDSEAARTLQPLIDALGVLP